ncbi:hypothetical protein CC2G_010389 [Coprinopsis cinerea AmutBmut pab1-1]|nr:hypothetical protein CC2G_010389 [Coprinopsis cinerea AmutBmut pab1-1]
MAPHKFWLKRQITIDLPDLPDLPGLPRPDPESSSTTPAETSTQPTSTEASTTNTGRPSQTPTPSVTPPPPPTQPTATSAPITDTSTRATPSPSVPAQEEPEEEENDIILIQSSDPVNRPTDSVAIVDLPATTVIQNRTITTDVTSSAIPTNVGAAKNSNAFLDNKVLSGVVFGICGLVGLLLILLLVFFVTRKTRRNRKLEQEIISWDPDHVQTFGNASGGSDANGAIGAGRAKDDDGRSIDSLDEKSKTSGSLDGHYTYALPSTTYKGNPNAAIPSAPYSNYGHPQPVHVALPTYGAQQQPYQSW